MKCLAMHLIDPQTAASSKVMQVALDGRDAL
jgi:hypothetical protein